MPGGSDLMVVDDKGLYCPAGGFHIDPWEPVERAVITHAHSDHARPGSSRYLASLDSAALLRHRIGDGISIESMAMGERRRIGGVHVSLHPAGHVLGSSQVRIEAKGRPTWCVTGDYKTEPDATCEPFEPVRCDVFVTESTFALPVFRWSAAAEVFDSLNAWRAQNAADGRTSVLLCYALGKAQRLLSGLDPSIGPIGAHGSINSLCEVYRDRGVPLPEVVHANKDTAELLRGGGTVLAPPSTLGGAWLRRFASRDAGMRTAMVSGWMSIRGRRRWRPVDRGFVLSDHADWSGLLSTIEATGAGRVLPTHGYASPLARFLREERGLDSSVLPTRRGDEDERGEPPDAGDEA